MSKIFAIGHGRHYTTQVKCSIPAGVTLYFAVPIRCNSTNTISLAYLKGELTQADCKETVVGPAVIPEHYLCADLPDTNLNKLIAFKTGIDKGVHTNSWLLATRGPSDVSLSAILARISELGLSPPVEIIWTCCRSPINEISDATYVNKLGTLEAKPKADKDPTAPPGSDGHKKYATDATGVLTLLHQDDIHSVGVRFSLRADRSDQLSTIGSAIWGSNQYSMDDLFGNPRIGQQTSGDTGLAF